MKLEAVGLRPLEIRPTQPGERVQSPTPCSSHSYTSGWEFVSRASSESRESKKRRVPSADIALGR